MRMSSVCSWPLKQCYLSTKYCTGILVENIIYFRILSDLLLPIFGISFPAHHIGVFKNELSHMLPEHGHRSWSSTMCSVKTTFLGSIHFSGSKWTCTTISQAFAWVRPTRPAGIFPRQRNKCFIYPRRPPEAKIPPHGAVETTWAPLHPRTVIGLCC